MAAMHNVQSIKHFLGTIRHIVADVLKSNAQQHGPTESWPTMAGVYEEPYQNRRLVWERNEMQALLSDINVSIYVYYTNLNVITSAINTFNMPLPSWNLIDDCEVPYYC